MKKETFTFDEVEAAVCLSEAINNEKIEAIDSYLANNGIAALRHDLINDCAPKLEAAYQKAVLFFGEHSQCFDLELVPRILVEVTRQSGTHFADQMTWDKAALKVIWILEFDDALRLHLKTCIDYQPLNKHEFYTLYGDKGLTDVKTAASNYATALTQAHPDAIKNRMNIVYQIDDDIILSVHDTPTKCDEELAWYYRDKPTDYPSDRTWNQISVPFGVPKENVIGSKHTDWR